MANKKKSDAEKRKKRLTPLQDKFAKELFSGKHATQTGAAIAAGYSPNNPRQSAYQALEGIKLKVPEMLDQAGLSVTALIHNHLLPQLHARETKFFRDGERCVDVVDWDARDKALDKAFRLHGAYAAKDGDNAAQFGVKVVVIDIPRPQRGVIEPDVLAPIQGPKDLPLVDNPRRGDGSDLIPPEGTPGYPPNGHKK